MKRDPTVLDWLMLISLATILVGRFILHFCGWWPIGS